jgi:hypothetical protein
MFSRVLVLVAFLTLHGPAQAQVLDKQKLLNAQSFWDNRDWDWYKANIPFFECPDPDITTTYYYRWELVTKHLTYGSPQGGYSFTEFIDRPFWSGAYGAISCPAGHQLYEIRWLRDPRYARDYSRYWFRTPGAQPRNYSCWLADAIWAVHRVHPDDAFIKDLLPDMVKNYEAWGKKHYSQEAGLFWQTGHDDGMEYNINSRQTKDLVRGAPGYRPTLNSYMYADAVAIARAAELAGDAEAAKRFKAKAAGIKENMQKKLWDPKRGFFLHMAKRDETADGQTVKAGSLIYQTGKHAGNEHGREEIGYVPWQFNLPDPGYESAWKYLMDADYFYSDYGPTTVERGDPLFYLSKTCCWWSGQSWPYATTQTLAAMANLLNNYRQSVVTKHDYIKLLKTYTRTQRKDGHPYIAEAAHPETGSWEGHDSYNHSEHYFHSGYNDLIITGLVGMRPRDDDQLEINPLAPQEWDYFALDDVNYRGRQLTILWDRDGKRYGRGKGLRILANGKEIGNAEKLSKVVVSLPVRGMNVKQKPAMNFAVNNEGRYYPNASASFANPRTPVQSVTDGNYWYHRDPPNRWTCEESPNESDWCAVEFGMKRRIHTVKLYVLDDGKGVTAPDRIDLEAWIGKTWQAIRGQKRAPEMPTGHRANTITFPELETDKVRAVFTHAALGKTGLTEFEVWGDATTLYVPPRSPIGNLALNEKGTGYPKPSASYTSRFDKVEAVNDGRIIFRPTPPNRWTSYESPNAIDWLEINFGSKKEVGRIELYIYDDGGGVQAPERYNVQWWDGSQWKDVGKVKKSPEKPTGGVKNTITFLRIETSKVRVVFTHQGKARSGLTEIEVFRE